jgi:predicted DCC family thiol-disulfide oxidoreductase YuxK
MTMGQPVILFDGVCVMCNGIARFVATRDERKFFRIEFLQSPTGQSILQEYHLSAGTFDTLYLIQEGHAYARSEAVIRIVKQLRPPWPLLGAIALLPLPIRDCLYKIVAQYRYKIFGKIAMCPLPEALTKSTATRQKI